MAAKAKRAARRAVAAHDRDERREVFDARRALYARVPSLVPVAYAVSTESPPEKPTTASSDAAGCDPLTRLSLSKAADDIVNNTPVAKSLEAIAPAPFDSAARAVTTSIGLVAPRELADASVDALAGAFLDAERTIILEYVAACRRYQGFFASTGSHARRFCRALYQLRRAEQMALDIDHGIHECLLEQDAATKAALKELSAVGAAAGLAICGGQATGLSRYRKLSDTTYIDVKAGVCVQAWPCRALLNAHIDSLNELANSHSSSFYVPLVAAVDVLGRCFAATALMTLQKERPVCIQPLKQPYIKYQLEVACADANFFFTNSNAGRSRDGSLATAASGGSAASTGTSPIFDEFLVASHSLVVFGDDARPYVLAARGLFPLLSMRMLRQASDCSPNRGLASMLHYFDGVLGGDKNKKKAKQQGTETALLDDDDEAKKRVEEEVLLFSSKELSKAKAKAARERIAAATGTSADGAASGINAGLRHILGDAVSVLDNVVEDLLSRAATRSAGGTDAVVRSMHSHGLSMRYVLSLFQRLEEKSQARRAVNDDPEYSRLAERHDSPFGTYEADMRLINASIRATATEVVARVLKHVVMQAWRGHFADAATIGARPPIAAMARIVDKVLLLVFPIPREDGELVLLPFAHRPVSPAALKHLTKAALQLFEKPRQGMPAWDTELHIDATQIAVRLCSMCGCTFSGGKVVDCAPVGINDVHLVVPERIRMAVAGRQRIVLSTLAQQLRFAREFRPKTVHLLALSLVDLYTQVSLQSVAVQTRPNSAIEDCDDTGDLSGAVRARASDSSQTLGKIDDLMTLVYPVDDGKGGFAAIARGEDSGGGSGGGGGCGAFASSSGPRGAPVALYLPEDEAVHLRTEILSRRLMLITSAEAAKKRSTFGEEFFNTLRAAMADFSDHVLSIARGSGESLQPVLVAQRVTRTCAALLHLEEQRTIAGHTEVADTNSTGTLAQHTIRTEKKKQQRRGTATKKTRSPGGGSGGMQSMELSAVGSEMSGLSPIRRKHPGANVGASKSLVQVGAAPPTPHAGPKSAWGDPADETPMASAGDFGEADSGGAWASGAVATSAGVGSMGSVPSRILRLMATFPAQCLDALNSAATNGRVAKPSVTWLYELLFEARWSVSNGFDRDNARAADGALRLAEEKRDFYTECLGEKSLEALAATADVAVAYAKLRRFEEARGHLVTVVSTLEAAKHPSRFIPANNLAFVHFAIANEMTPAKLKAVTNKGVRLPLPVLGHLDAAEQIIATLVAEQRREAAGYDSRAEKHMTPALMGDVYNNLGSLLTFKRKYSAAIEAYESALAATAGVLNDSHPDRALANRNIKVCKRRQYDNALYFLRLWARRFAARKMVLRLKSLKAVALCLQPLGRAFMNRRLLGKVMRRRYHGVKNTTWRAAVVLQSIGRGFAMRAMMARALRAMATRKKRTRRAFVIKSEAAAPPEPLGPVGLQPHPHDAPKHSDELSVGPVVPITAAALADLAAGPTAEEPVKTTPTNAEKISADPQPQEEQHADDETAPARELRRRHRAGNLARLPEPAKIVGDYPIARTPAPVPAKVSKPPPPEAASPAAEPIISKAAPPPPPTSVAASAMAPRDPLQAAAVTAYYRQRLLALYAFYGLPKKLEGVDKNLGKYAGQEQAFLVAMTEKYGPEPPKERRAQLVAKAYAMCPSLRDSQQKPAVSIAASPDFKKRPAPSEHSSRHSRGKAAAPLPLPPGEEEVRSVRAPSSRASSASSRAPRSEKSARASAGLGRGRRGSKSAKAPGVTKAGLQLLDSAPPLDPMSLLGTDASPSKAHAHRHAVNEARKSVGPSRNDNEARAADVPDVAGDDPTHHAGRWRAPKKQPEDVITAAAVVAPAPGPIEVDVDEL